MADPAVAARTVSETRPRRSLFVLLVAGAALLLGLAVWQTARAVERVRWIDLAQERAALPPVALPANPAPIEHAMLPVRVNGRFDHTAAQRVYAFDPADGPGHRLVVPLDTEDGRRILVDRGFVVDTATPAEDGGMASVAGLLLWPREKGPFTPERDAQSGLWYARDVPALAVAATAEPVLVVASESPPGAWPRAAPPVFEPGNRHVGYAVTWTALAAAWAAIFGLLWRRSGQRA